MGRRNPIWPGLVALVLAVGVACLVMLTDSDALR